MPFGGGGGVGIKWPPSPLDTLLFGMLKWQGGFCHQLLRTEDGTTSWNCPSPASPGVSSRGAGDVEHCGTLCLKLASLGSTDNICFGKEPDSLFSNLFRGRLSNTSALIMRDELTGLASAWAGVTLEAQQRPHSLPSAPSCWPGLCTLPGSQACQSGQPRAEE